MNKDEIRVKVAAAVEKAKKETPLAPSITNNVTINLVANTQLAVGGSAAMIYLPDEGAAMAKICGAMYINMGTIIPVYLESLPLTAKTLYENHKPWVLDPVGFGIGEIRGKVMEQFKEYKPSIVRGNASEIIGVAKSWGLLADSTSDGPRGVDSVDTVDAAAKAAVELAKFIGGAVAVSGATDLITDGETVVYAKGGSHFMEKITGAGCSLGGVCAVYAAVADPFAAALAGTFMYNWAGAEAEKLAKGPASFQVEFIDKLYQATGQQVAGIDFEVQEA